MLEARPASLKLRLLRHSQQAPSITTLNGWMVLLPREIKNIYSPARAETWRMELRQAVRGHSRLTKQVRARVDMIKVQEYPWQGKT